MVALAVGSVLATGCYTMIPVASDAPLLGSVVALSINDAGRVALGGSMGPEIDQVEGRLVSLDSAGYQVAVTTVHLLRGGVQNWSGERVEIRTEHVRSVQERHFSRTRTAIVASVAVAGLAALLRGNLIGAGGREPDDVPGDSAEAIRIPWPLVRLQRAFP
jgi:hypothetical protein